MKFAKVALAATLMAATASMPALAKNSVQRVPSKIDWSAAKIATKRAVAQNAVTLNKFVDEAPKELKAMELPVLIFGSSAKLATPRFAGQGSAYATYYDLEGAQISILGSHSVLSGTDDLTLHHKTGAYESIGDGADYNLNRFGAFYTIRITCDQPTEDTRCTKPDYLTSVAQSLIVVNGANQ
ncbi:hypothetical protein [Pseudovibrio sp. Tun.PSC04-5.I4]|uniref:hypothetical protein n=1 Tax=Pseudovibrio sp. Tun.PSC04-5.I4 TaxID=1798213 RepID=UPI00088BDCBF|nr:hypothetical protein [Pseudovibrio sp. Tun.PSC04-5.I4]SDQ33734.1 hypothetical protein SAMN04515695_0917 [Pseudovibrio sp. Tun.PSC04-5.I4]